MKLPLHGPHFLPPEFLDASKRQAAPEYHPKTLYLKPVMILHPFYFAAQLSSCPRCRSNRISWEGWTTSGHCDVYSLRFNETAIGCQLSCKACHEQKMEGEKIVSKFASTNPVFWDAWEHWKIPR